MSATGEPVAGGPPPPAGSLPAGTVCNMQNDPRCQTYSCSTVLGLCYETTNGYVWNPNTNSWTEPPKGVGGCDADQVYWPKFGYCYLPETGWIFNPEVQAWQFYGIDYTEKKEPAGDDSGCAVSGAGASRSESSWMLVGLLGAALGLSYRRRSA